MRRKTIVFGFIFLVILFVLFCILVVGVKEVFSDGSGNYSFPLPNSAEDEKGAKAFIISQLREILARLDELEKIQGDKDTQKIILEIKKIYEGLSARQDVWGSALLKDKNSRVVFLEGEIARKDSFLTQVSQKLAEALGRIKELEKQLAEKPEGVSQSEYNQLKQENKSFVDQIANLQDKLMQAQARKEKSPLPVDFSEKESPKKFSVGLCVIGQQKVYSSFLGYVIDNRIHTGVEIPIYVEVSARKFLIKDFLAIQGFGGIGSAWFVGVGMVGYIDFFNVSISGGAQYFPDCLVGNLGPVQGFAELTHEGKWTRMSLRILPGIRLAQLSVGVKF